MVRERGRVKEEEETARCCPMKRPARHVARSGCECRGLERHPLRGVHESAPISEDREPCRADLAPRG